MKKQSTAYVAIVEQIAIDMFFFRLINMRQEDRKCDIGSEGANLDRHTLCVDDVDCVHMDI